MKPTRDQAFFKGIASQATFDPADIATLFT